MIIFRLTQDYRSLFLFVSCFQIGNACPTIHFNCAFCLAYTARAAFNPCSICPKRKVVISSHGNSWVAWTHGPICITQSGKRNAFEGFWRFHKVFQGILFFSHLSFLSLSSFCCIIPQVTPYIYELNTTTDNVVYTEWPLDSCKLVVNHGQDISGHILTVQTIQNTPDDPNAINAPIMITRATTPDRYIPRLSVTTDLLQSPDTSLERPHSPASVTMSASPTASSFVQCAAPEKEKLRLHIHHQDENSNSDTRIMIFWPDEDTFASLITRIQHKLNDNNINRLKYLNRDGIEIVVGDDEDLLISFYLDRQTEHSFWTMHRKESL